jgi:Family of unknown function (DUF5808)
MIRRIRRLVKIAGLAVFVAAIAQEMAKPESERTWRGKVGGVVPYDFRPPTWDRLMEAYWNPSDPRLFTDRVFGVGWAINLFRAKEYMKATYESLMGGKGSASERWHQRTARTSPSTKTKAAENS